MKSYTPEQKARRRDYAREWYRKSRGNLFTGKKGRRPPLYTRAERRALTFLRRLDKSILARQRLLDGLKVCRRCGNDRSASPDRDGRCSRCYQVKRARRRLRQKLDPRHRAKKREYNATARKNRRARLKSQGHVSAAMWDLVRRVYGDACLCCGSSVDVTMDHVIPLAHGGLHHQSNLQPLCRVCNSRKNARAIDYRPFPWDVPLATIRWNQPLPSLLRPHAPDLP